MGKQKVSKQYLSTKALALISEFALVLYRHDQTLIDVQADDVLSQIAEKARCTNDAKVRSVFIRIRAELRSYLGGKATEDSTGPRSESTLELQSKPERQPIRTGLL